MSRRRDIPYRVLRDGKLSATPGAPVPLLRSSRGRVKFLAAATDGFTLSGNGSSQPYEAATTGRRLGTWGLGNWGPNAAVTGSLSGIRSRAREMARNNPWFKKAVNNFVSNAIGTGITPRWNLEDAALKETIRKLFDRWTWKADADGACDFYGLQALVARTFYKSGEVLVRFRPRRLSDGLPVPAQLQVLEPDHLDESRDGTLSAGGNLIRSGIEFNGVGQRVAYWLRREHPGETYPMSGIGGVETVRVPASEILHVFHRERPGQIRGVPTISASLMSLYELDGYEDAEIVRKRGAAVIGGVITQAAAVDADSPLPFGTNEGEDSEGQTVVAIEPGTYPLLEPGQALSALPAADVGSSYEPWMKQQLRRIAAGLLATYEQISGDLSDVNFSSIRAGILEARRLLEQLIWNVFIFQFCQPTTEWWLAMAVASGKLEISDFVENRDLYTDVAWRPARWYWVDPKADVEAEIKSVRAGFKSRGAVVSEIGDDVEEVDREIAEDNRRADKLGLVFDSDPRRTSDAGLTQARPEGSVEPAMQDDEDEEASDVEDEARAE